MGGQLQGQPALVVLLGVAVLAAVPMPVRLLVEVLDLQVVVVIVEIVGVVVVVWVVGLQDYLWMLEQWGRLGPRRLLQQQGL